MATLAAQIETDIQVLEEDLSLKAITNKRSANTAINAAMLTKACEHAAAVVQSHLGSTVDSTNTMAVHIGVRLAAIYLRNKFGGELRPEAENEESKLMAELERLAARDREENDDHLVWHAPDTTGADRRYPAAQRGRGYEQSTEESGG